MCVPAAWPVSDIGVLSSSVVFVSGTWTWHPSHTGNRPWPPSFTLNTQEIYTGNCVSGPHAWLAHSSISHSSPTDPRGGLSAKTPLHTQLTTCLISLLCVQSPLHPLSPSPHILHPGLRSAKSVF